MTFQSALVITCAISRVELNLERVIIDEWDHFFDNSKDMFLPSLITELCKRENLSVEPRDT